jgi:hypothetical protein
MERGMQFLGTRACALNLRIPNFKDDIPCLRKVPGCAGGYTQWISNREHVAECNGEADSIENYKI